MDTNECHDTNLRAGVVSLDLMGWWSDVVEKKRKRDKTQKEKEITRDKKEKMRSLSKKKKKGKDLMRE